MAKVISFTRLPSTSGGRGAVMAIGTAAALTDGGSFAVTLASAGSQVMRNIQAVVVTQIGTVAALPTATGSSSGYVTINVTRLGTFVNAAQGGTIDLQFFAIGGGGSI